MTLFLFHSYLRPSIWNGEVAEVCKEQGCGKFFTRNALSKNAVCRKFCDGHPRPVEAARSFNLGAGANWIYV